MARSRIKGLRNSLAPGGLLYPGASPVLRGAAAASTDVALPFTYDISTEFSAAAVGTEVSAAIPDEWSNEIVSEGRGSWYVSDVVADPNSYVPSGVTKTIRCLSTDFTTGSGQNAMWTPQGNFPRPSVLRVAFLERTTQSNRGGPFVGFNSPSEDVYTSVAKSTDNPAKARVSERYVNGGTGYTTFNWATSTAINSGPTSRDGRYWMWVMVEFDFSNNTVYWRTRRAEDATNRYDEKSGAMPAEGAALSQSPDGWDRIYFRQTASDAGLYTYISKFWIGTGDDDWPT